jgi:molybdenum-dependent DNA-binding transcriptional regulator ModE
MLTSKIKEAFHASVIEGRTGDMHGGGDNLNGLGRRMVNRYRAIETKSASAKYFERRTHWIE